MRHSLALTTVRRTSVGLLVWRGRARPSMVLVTSESRDERSPACAIEALPAPYAVALRLRDAGASVELIAAALGVDAKTIPGILHLAEAKLASASLPVTSSDP